MARPQSCAVVAVEVLVEKYVIAKVRIGLKQSVAVISRPLPFSIRQEQRGQAAGQTRRRLTQSHAIAGTGRQFHLKAVAVVKIEALQGLDDEKVHWKPHGAAPV